MSIIVALMPEGFGPMLIGKGTLLHLEPHAVDTLLHVQYSTASGTGNRAGAYGLSQYEAMPAGVFNTSQMLASSQRSGSEAKGCIKW